MKKRNEKTTNDDDDDEWMNTVKLYYNKVNSSLHKKNKSQLGWSLPQKITRNKNLLTHHRQLYCCRYKFFYSVTIYNAMKRKMLTHNNSVLWKCALHPVKMYTVSLEKSILFPLSLDVLMQLIFLLTLKVHFPDWFPSVLRLSNLCKCLSFRGKNNGLQRMCDVAATIPATRKLWCWQKNPTSTFFTLNLFIEKWKRFG